MVAVRVSDDHRIQTPDLRREQLLAQIGPAVDQQALVGAFDEDRRA
jgi:hypothetical protein